MPIVSAVVTKDRLPAWSVARASTVCSPSPSTRLLPDVQLPLSSRYSTEATPLSASVAWIESVTGLVYQPSVPGVPEGVKVIDGGVLSTWKLSEVVARSPA